MEQYKTCPDCGQTKPFSSFHNNRKTKDKKATYCKICLNLRGKSYRLQNPERVKETNKTSKAKSADKARQTKKLWREKNREAINAQKRAKRAANPEHYRQLAKKQYAKSKESALNSAARRQARIKSCKTFVITAKEIALLRASVCFYCGAKDQIELDHVVPISRMGDHGIGNLVPACLPCNRSKGDLFITEWQFKLKR
jgi:5-methylcytosine-specific restriction endonuclease McrA